MPPVPVCTMAGLTAAMIAKHDRADFVLQTAGMVHGGRSTDRAPADVRFRWLHGFDRILLTDPGLVTARLSLRGRSDRSTRR